VAGAVEAAPPVWRIRDRRSFEELRRRGRRTRRGPLTMVFLAEPAVGPPRVAYAVSGRPGGAVARNRIRRRLRAAVRGADLGAGTYLLIAGPDAGSCPYSELESVVRSAADDLATRASS
jgi:ribonuclease P protein component